MSLILDSLSDPHLPALLAGGAVGVIPTDTVYGLVCLAANKAAAERLYKLKFKQPAQKPGTIIAANIEQLVELGLKARYLKPVESYWPGPLSIVIPNFELVYLHLGKGSLAVRLPSEKSLISLLEQTGPLLTTSANLTGQQTANSLIEAREYFKGTVDFYVEGGSLAGHMPSTIIRVIDDEIEVLREGEVKISANGAIEK